MCSAAYAADHSSTAEQVTGKSDRLSPSRPRVIEQLWPTRLKPVFHEQTNSNIPVKMGIPLMTGRVVDNANLLLPAERNELERLMQVLADKNTVDMAILTVNKLQGMRIESFSLKVAETWRLGRQHTTGSYSRNRARNNGLLITYAVGEDLYRVEVGRGLDRVITNSLAAGIIRKQLRANADPKSGKRDFFSAFRKGIIRIEELSEGSNFDKYFQLIFKVFVFTAVIIMLFYRISAGEGGSRSSRSGFPYLGGGGGSSGGGGGGGFGGGGATG